MIRDVGPRDRQSETRPKTVAVDRTLQVAVWCTVRVRKGILIRDQQLRTKVPAQVHKVNHISELCEGCPCLYLLVATMTVDFGDTKRLGFPQEEPGRLSGSGIGTHLLLRVLADPWIQFTMAPNKKRNQPPPPSPPPTDAPALEDTSTETPQPIPPIDVFYCKGQ